MKSSTSPSSSLGRRDFLKTAAFGGAIAGFPALLRSANPNSHVQLAAIGVTGQGYQDLHNVAQHPKCRVVAFCDVDRANFAKADLEHPGTPHYSDFRRMLDEQGDKIDAVTIGIPDHMHALAAIEAMKRGKHVYCEKPLAHTVAEVRELRKWAAKTGVVTQMGNQFHSSVEYRLAANLLQTGAIGKVREVHSWAVVAGNEKTRLLEPPAAGPVPASLDWNTWIGGASMRDYAPEVYHPFAWRDWQDFGSGALGDFGCHILDPVFTGLKLGPPRSIVAAHTGINRHIWPCAETVRYVFPGNDLTAKHELVVTWTDGGLRPDRKKALLPPEVDLPKDGSLFIGESGNLVLGHVSAPRLYPLERYKDYPYAKNFKGLNHWHLWIDAIIGGTKTDGGFDYASLLSESVQLGNLASRVANRIPVHRGSRPIDPAGATPLLWDAENLAITNHPLAHQLLTKVYRPGWELPRA